MLVKVSQTTEAQINWLIAGIQGYECIKPSWPGSSFTCLIEGREVFFSPATNSAQGLEIIDTNKITISQSREIRASIWQVGLPIGRDWYRFKQTGSTVLIAAMRTFIESVMGPEVEIPDVFPDVLNLKGQSTSEKSEYKEKENSDHGVHASHCNQGENEGYCKYGKDDCPVMASEKVKYGLKHRMTLQEFDELVNPFLDSFVGSYAEDRYETEGGRAEDVVSDLKKFIFAIDPAKEERRKKFLKLKAEFEPGE